MRSSGRCRRDRAGLRLGVYTDYAYHRVGDEVMAERAFALFLAGLRDHFERLLLIGRLSPGGAEARYPLGPRVELLALPFYSTLSRPLQTLPSFGRSLVIFWRSLAQLDVVWLLGPHPFALVFAVLALARRKRVVLGVRQDMPAYVRSRHPRRYHLHLAAWILEGAFRIVGRFVPVVAVGPELAHNYHHSLKLLELTVSLISQRDLVDPEQALDRDYSGELHLLAVGRLEQEKNPMLLADALELLNRDEARWRLIVCGEGELAAQLEARLAALGQSQQAQLLGYVPFGEQLAKLYGDSHLLLHTSWTEGLPAVLLEAFAAGLPVVAADVGGIAEAIGEAALLVAPGDAMAAAGAASAVVEDAQLRERLVRAGHNYARAHTVEIESQKLAGFLARA